MFGSPETTTGGRALKFYASVRLDVRKIDTIKANGDVVGNKTRIKVVKNKIAPPFKQAEFDIMYGQGISHESSLLDLATSMEIINKSGSWYSYNDIRMGQGRETSKEYLQNNLEIAKEIELKVRAQAASLSLNSILPLTESIENLEEDNLDEILQEKEIFIDK